MSSKRLIAWLLGALGIAGMAFAVLEYLNTAASHAGYDGGFYRLLVVLLGSYLILVCAVALGASSTARQRAERQQAEHLRSILAGMDHGVLVLAPDRRIVAINASARRFVPMNEGDVVPQDWTHRHAFMLDGTSPFPLEEVPLTGALSGEARSDVQLMMRDDQELLRAVSIDTRPLQEHGRVVGCVTVLQDISERRRLEQGLRDSEQRLATLSSQREASSKEHAYLLRVLSLRDELTGLYNRQCFTEIGEHALRTLARSKLAGCLFVVDVDGLRAINDSLGREVGDRALGAAAKILTRVFRDSDVVARLGGDEFAVLALECGLADIPSVLDRFAEQVAASNRVHTDFVLSMSIGSALFEPPAAVDFGGLVDAAAQAMHEQKRLYRERRQA